MVKVKFQLQEAWTIGNMGFGLSWITYIEEVSCPFWSILQLYLSGNTILIQNTVNMHSLSLGNRSPKRLKRLRGRLGNQALWMVAFGPLCYIWDGPIRTVMGGGWEIFEPQEFFFFVIKFLVWIFFGHSISFRVNWRARFFSFNFPLR